jgi:surface polysaccharide O-acyltransferase-like enzyme
MTSLSQSQSLRPALRESQFELLRIVCVLMIVCIHIIIFRGNPVVGSFDYWVRNLLLPFSYVCVNCFVLISGYFGISFKWRKLARIDSMVIFFSLFYLAIFVYLGLHRFNIKRDLIFFMPVISRCYWFITVYFGLYILSPFLNRVVSSMSRASFRKLLLVLFILLSFCPTVGYIFNFNSLTIDAGKDLLFFCFLYFIGRYLRLHYVDNHSARFYLFLYLGISLFLLVFEYFYSVILHVYYDYLLNNDSVFILFSSICFFLFFRHFSFRSRIINYIATFCLCVYVLHGNGLFANYFRYKSGFLTSFTGWNSVLMLILLPICIFLASMLLEIIRRFLFSSVAYLFRLVFPRKVGVE